jgi:retron-type reverse transcriptase
MDANMPKRTEDTPAAVPLAQQAGDARSRWRWAEPCVWTVRMLTALEQGVQGEKWHRLFDKVFAERNLLASFQRVAAKRGAAGVDHLTTRDFERRLPEAIGALSSLLRSGKFTPQAIRRVQIPKPGTRETRPLGIPTVRDRVVQGAIVNVIEPIFERDFAEHSYGFRPGRGCKDALRRVDQLLRAGYVHVVDADLKGYFDSIPHDRLMERLETKLADGPVLRLIAAFLKADILDEAAQWTPEQGAPQGAVLSPLLSNIYLDPLDHLVAQAGFEMVRYADDFSRCTPPRRKSSTRGPNASTSWAIASAVSTTGRGTRAARSSKTRFGPRPNATRATVCRGSCSGSTRSYGDGSRTSSTAPIPRCIAPSTAGYAAACGASSANAAADAAWEEGRITTAGPIASSPRTGCTVWQPPMPRPVNPQRGNTIHRRAGCGKPARPVRREGGPNPIGPPYPYTSVAPAGAA